MSVSLRRAKEINEYFISHGESNTAKKYDVSIETLYRYLRMANSSKSQRHPKILLFDIETLPLVAYSWGLYKQNLSYDNIIKDWACLSWAAKWLYSSEIKSMILTPKEATDRDDSRIMKGLWELFNQSDIIIAHNCKNFDNKRAKTRFFLNNLKPPSPYQMIDTLEVARREFSFASNRLDYLGLIMVRKQKIETDYKLWKRCDAGDPEALDYMCKYNEEDVNLLEEVYLELRPWMRSHPNIAIYSESDGEMCPVCGQCNLEESGYYTTMAGRYESLICKDCGANSRRRQTVLTKKQRDNLLISNAR
jgi:hypothetical protein